MAAPAKKIEVTVRLWPETLAVVDAVAEVWTREHCTAENPDAYTREQILQECIIRGLVLEERENLGTRTVNPNAPVEWAPFEPQDERDADAFTDLMLALKTGAAELRRRAVRLHDRAENTRHDDKWEETAAELNHARRLDADADVLLAEHARMIKRQWRADQTPAARARRGEVQEEFARDEPERELRGARNSLAYARRHLREVEAKNKGKRRHRARRSARRAKAMVEHAHQNGAAP